MRVFMLTTAICYVLLFGIACLCSPYLLVDGLDVFTLALLICLPPIVGTYAMTRLLNTVRPRRILAKKPFFDLAPVWAGVAVAVLTVILASIALVLLDHWISDVLILGSASCIAVPLVLHFCASSRPGYCLRCNYDLRGAQRPRCPECGLIFDQRMVLPV